MSYKEMVFSLIHGAAQGMCSNHWPVASRSSWGNENKKSEVSWEAAHRDTVVPLWLQIEESNQWPCEYWEKPSVTAQRPSPFLLCCRQRPVPPPSPPRLAPVTQVTTEIPFIYSSLIHDLPRLTFLTPQLVHALRYNHILAMLMGRPNYNCFYYRSK